MESELNEPTLLSDAYEWASAEEGRRYRVGAREDGIVWEFQDGNSGRWLLATRIGALLSEFLFLANRYRELRKAELKWREKCDLTESACDTWHRSYQEMVGMHRREVEAASARAEEINRLRAKLLCADLRYESEKLARQKAEQRIGNLLDDSNDDRDRIRLANNVIHDKSARIAELERALRAAVGECNEARRNFNTAETNRLLGLAAERELRRERDEARAETKVAKGQFLVADLARMAAQDELKYLRGLLQDDAPPLGLIHVLAKEEFNETVPAGMSTAARKIAGIAWRWFQAKFGTRSDEVKDCGFVDPGAGGEPRTVDRRGEEDISSHPHRP